MTGDYSESIERSIELLRDGDHAGHYVGTIDPDPDGGVNIEGVLGVDSDAYSMGKAKLELLATHLLVTATEADMSPREIAIHTATLIERGELLPEHAVTVGES